MGSLSRLSSGRRLAVWAALALGWMLPSTGCQVEYAGMTLPSGKYMHDDVQYFAPGPDFPWANTQAATQRARMQAMGMETPPPGVPVPAAGPAVETPPPPPAPGGVAPPAPVVPAFPAPGVPVPAPVVPPPAGGVPAPPAAEQPPPAAENPK
jgi:hypothetical protein